MQYKENIIMKNGKPCLISTPSPEDAPEVLRCFLRTHEETEYLTSYPEENHITLEDERAFIEKQNAAADSMELCAYVNGVIVGTAGFNRIGRYEKLKHRGEFGISIEKAYWGLGIGRALTEACIACARKAGLMQLELEVVAANEKAVRLYESAGFVAYGRNPLGFRTRGGEWQELILMRMEL